MNTVKKQLSIVQHAVDKYQKLPTQEHVARDCGVSLFKAKAILRRYMIYQYIKQYIAENQYPPSRREISTMLHIPLSIIQHHINQLILADMITTSPGRSRTIRLPEKSA